MSISRRLFEDINYVVNPYFQKQIDSVILYEAILNEDVLLLESLMSSSLRQKLSRIVKDTSKLSAAAIAFLMLSSGELKACYSGIEKQSAFKIDVPGFGIEDSKSSTETSCISQEKLQKIYNELEKKGIKSSVKPEDSQRLLIVNVSPVQRNYFIGKKGNKLQNGTVIPIDWNSEKEDFYFALVKTRSGYYHTILDTYKNNESLLVMSKDEKYFWMLQKSRASKGGKSFTRWAMIQKFSTNTLGPLARKYFSLLKIFDEDRKKLEIDSRNIKPKSK
jgi:hypothetical protein